MRPAPSVSVVLLCFNEAEAIADCVQSAFTTLSPITSDLEVIVVEDGSSDGSPCVLRALQPVYPAMKIVPHLRNMGYGRSLAAGIRQATKNYVLCVDGDNQFDFDDARMLLDQLQIGGQIVSGCRTPRADRWYRRILGTIYNQCIRSVFGLEVADIDCGFKLLQREVAARLFPTRSNFAAWAEAMIKAKRLSYRCANVVIRHRARPAGKSAVFKPRIVAKMLQEVASITLRFKLTKVAATDLLP